MRISSLIGSAAVAGLAVWLDADPALSLDGTPSPNAAAVPPPLPRCRRARCRRSPRRRPRSRRPSAQRRAVAGRCVPPRHRGAQGRRAQERADLAAIRRRARPRRRALAARPHVCRGRWRGARRSPRLRIFPQVRRQPRRRPSGDAALALCRQRLRGARPLLSRRHSELGGGSRAPSGRGGCSITRPRTSAIRRRSISSPRSTSTATASAAMPSARCRGSRSPPTRATTSRRRCSAASCSAASTACASAASGLMWLTVASDGPGGAVPWIAELRESAFKQATDHERATALVLLERWVEGRARSRPSKRRVSGRVDRQST